MSLVISPLSPAIGVKIYGLDLKLKLGADTIDVIKHQWHQHGVICIPNQILSESDQIQFGEYFGELVTTLGEYKISTSHPSIMYVTNEKENGKYVGALPDGEMFFHSDMCYVEKPSMATILYAITIPSMGGNTVFANMYKAYETLSPEVKSKIESLKAVHSYEPGEKATMNVSRIKEPSGPSARRFSHPMVCTHPETGQKALYVNRLMTETVEGLSNEKSQELLEFLFDHQESKQFIYEHCWQVGDLVMWDNRCVLHARQDFNAQELRKLRRITIKGDRIR
ncbi:MAG: TauD/TfdA family dioxygenase [Betaproteobacteria bacterium]|jgi:taurine dioxygenase